MFIINVSVTYMSMFKICIINCTNYINLWHMYIHILWCFCMYKYMLCNISKQNFTVLPAVHHLLFCNWRLLHLRMAQGNVSALLPWYVILCKHGLWEATSEATNGTSLGKEGNRLSSPLTPCLELKGSRFAHPELGLCSLGQYEERTCQQCGAQRRGLIILNSCRHKHLMQNFQRSTRWEHISSHLDNCLFSDVLALPRKLSWLIPCC